MSRFHHDPAALKKLTPPPIFLQVHDFEPLAEGARADFTMWFGPFPVRWQAAHSNVSRHGFTDTQVHGPLKRWQHGHEFKAVDANTSRVNDHVEYEHYDGRRSLLTRLLFNRFGLTLLFMARKWLTRWHVAQSAARAADRSR